MREFVELAFGHIGRTIAWRGKGIDERGIDAQSGVELVRVDPTYFRPTEVDLLVGDPAKARAKLGWRHSVSFPELVREMVESDVRALAEERSGAARGGVVAPMRDVARVGEVR